MSIYLTVECFIPLDYLSDQDKVNRHNSAHKACCRYAQVGAVFAVSSNVVVRLALMKRVS